MTLERAYKLRWVAVAVCVSGVYILGPLAADAYYWATGDDRGDELVWAGSVALHFLVLWWIAGWPVLRFMLTGRDR